MDNILGWGCEHSLRGKESNHLPPPVMEYSVILSLIPLTAGRTFSAREICTCAGQVDGRVFVVMIANKIHFSSIAITSQ